MKKLLIICFIPLLFAFSCNKEERRKAVVKTLSTALAGTVTYYGNCESGLSIYPWAKRQIEKVPMLKDPATIDKFIEIDETKGRKSVVAQLICMEVMNIAISFAINEPLPVEAKCEKTIVELKGLIAQRACSNL